MAKFPSSAGQRPLVILTGTIVGVVVIACLYWAQTIFIPVALAIYLTFLLGPLVRVIQRRGLGRMPATLLVVLLVAVLLVGIGWIVTYEVANLVAELPGYSSNITAKIKALRSSSEGSAWSALDHMVKTITGELKAPAEQSVPDKATPAGTEKPAPVTLQPDSPAWLSRLPSVFGYVAELLAGLVLTIILVIFMLIKREDLRNRVLSLVGHGRLTVTTKAVDEASQRISRFLMMQAVINGTFGLVLAAGLFIIGVPYAFLWGALAGILRYIPYIGTWIAAAPPIILSIAMFEGWLAPLEVLGLFLAIELVWANVLEPRLFGRSMGVSEVALLVAAAFWAFLWGPIGLVLSNPLTVCLVVLGKYVPQLEFFTLLLGDEPALEADVSYYQRLLARDQDEAEELVQTQITATSLVQTYDEVLIRALTYAKRDRERDTLSEADEEFILRATGEVVEDLEEQGVTSDADAKKDGGKLKASGRVPVLGVPARDEADRLALEMFRQTLDATKWDLEIAGIELLSAELIALVAERKPALICIASVPPGGLAHTRYLCKRLRARVPETKIIVGRWGLRGNVEQNETQLRAAGADVVTTKLAETRHHFDAWLPVFVAAGTADVDVDEADAPTELNSNSGIPVAQL